MVPSATNQTCNGNETEKQNRSQIKQAPLHGLKGDEPYKSKPLFQHSNEQNKSSQPHLICRLSEKGGGSWKNEKMTVRDDYRISVDTKTEGKNRNRWAFYLLDWEIVSVCDCTHIIVWVFAVHYCYCTSFSWFLWLIICVHTNKFVWETIRVI